jgi:NAD(P)-dependent dehydrogenase (short-subunit alcohol dehydrogenase family)
MNLQLENKLALVTGSTAGIGFAIVKALPPKGRVIILRVNRANGAWNDYWSQQELKQAA